MLVVARVSSSKICFWECPRANRELLQGWSCHSESVFVEIREVLNGVGADGVGVKFPILPVNCNRLLLPWGKTEKNDEKRETKKRQRKPKKSEEKKKRRKTKRIKKRGKIPPTPSKPTPEKRKKAKKSKKTN